MIELKNHFTNSPPPAVQNQTAAVSYPNRFVD
jgi:hypothetical protein